MSLGLDQFFRGLCVIMEILTSGVLSVKTFLKSFSFPGHDVDDAGGYNYQNLPAPTSDESVHRLEDFSLLWREFVIPHAEYLGPDRGARRPRR